MSNNRFHFKRYKGKPHYKWTQFEVFKWRYQCSCYNNNPNLFWSLGSLHHPKYREFKKVYRPKPSIRRETTKYKHRPFLMTGAHFQRQLFNS